MRLSRTHQAQGFIQKFGRGQSIVCKRKKAQTHINLVVQKPVLDIRGRLSLHLEVYVRELLSEAGDHRRNEICIHGRDGPDHPPAPFSSYQFTDSLTGLLKIAQHPPRMFLKKKTRRCEFDMASYPVE